MSKLIPNSFQYPNILVDQLAHLLTPEENVVLNKAVREILGWHNRIEERKAPISLSVFVNGKVKKDGTRLCHGCGLGLGVVRKALAKLNEYNILIKIGRPTQDGQLYWLQSDDGKISWPELEVRHSKKKLTDKERTQKAT